MAERLTGSHERSEERSPRQRLRTLLAAASVALAAGAAEAGEKSPDLEAGLAPVTTPAPKPRPDQLVRLLGEETAQEIRVALDECLAEYRDIAEEVKADGGDVVEVSEVMELGAEDCAEQQHLDVAIALEDRQQALARAAIDAENARQAELREEAVQTIAERDALRAQRAALEADTAQRLADTAELKAINDELSDMLIAGAICEANGDAEAECGVDRERMEELFRRARELATPSADREPVDVSEAVPKDDDTRVASLEAERAKTQ